MFKISRKGSLFRISLLSFAAVLVMVFLVFFIAKNINKNVDAANTEDGATVQIVPGAVVGYEGWTTNIFQVKSGDVYYEGMCADPMKGTPSGNWPVIKITNEDDWQKDIKLLLYIFYAHTDANNAYLEQIFQNHPDYTFRYGHIHAVVAYLKTHGADTTGLGAGAIQWVQTVIGELDAMRAGADIAGSSTRWQEAQSYQLYMTDTSRYPGLQSIMWIEYNESSSQPDEPKYAQIIVNKADTDSSVAGCSNVAGLSFKGTVFGLYKYETNQLVAKAEITDNSCTAIFSYIPYGNYVVRELNAAYGYTLSWPTGDAPVTATMPVALVNFHNAPLKGKVTVTKSDSATGTCTGSTGTSLVGTKFSILNSTGGSVRYNGNDFANGAVIDSKTVGDSTCKVTFDDLPYGKYTVREDSTTTDYNIDVASKEVTISSSTASVAFSNTVKLGKITVTKTDSVTGTCTASGSLTLAGTKFTLVNKTGRTIAYAGRQIANNATVDTKTIANGACGVEFTGLPYGNYAVTETASAGYTATSSSKNVTLSSASASVSFSNAPVLGKVTVTKKDSNTNSCTTVGNASFSGVTFSITNNSLNPVYYGGKFVAKGAVIDTKALNTSTCTVTFENLPYGSYIVKEVGAGTGYKANNNSNNVTIPTNNSVEVTTSFTNEPILGKITVNKTDKDTGTCTTVGDASFANTVFTLTNNSSRAIYYDGRSIAVGAVVDTKTLNTSNCTAVFENLPYGTYSVRESAVGSGYNLNDKVETVTIPTNNSVNVTTGYVNTPKLGKVTVTKKDKDTNSCTTVGNASFSGVTFSITNNSLNPVYYGGKFVAKGAVIDTKALNTSTCTVTFENLPYGSYIVKEVGAGTGYKANNNSNNVTIPTNNSVEVTTSFTNEPILGKVSVEKVDEHTGTCTPVGDATLAGTTFSITNNSTNAIYYNGRAVAKGAVIDTKTVDSSNCIATFENLPYGTYIVKETAASRGYKDNTAVKTVTIPTNNNTTVTTKYSNEAILGKLTVNKIDKDTGSCVNTFGINFTGATFTVTNDSTNPIYYNNRFVAKGAVIDTKTLADGQCNLTFENLPYGTYLVKETKASKGYVADPEIHRVTIPNQGNSEVNVSTTMENQPIRGDLKFVKMDATNNKPLSDVIFSITAIDSNFNLHETHIVMSDKNGVVDTSSSFALHSFHTNGYDALYDEVDPLSFLGYGDWFGEDANGNAVPVRDEVGALPYGKYIVQELRCGSNLFCNNILGEKLIVEINEHNKVIDLGDWDNACIEFSLATQASDEKDGDKYIEVGKDVKLKDTIDYCVKANTDFRIKGILMDKSTGEPLIINGNTVEQEIKLNSEEECGTTFMTFTFDGSELGGKELVVFETLYYKDDIITKHDDIEDEGQTVEMVKLRTTATNNETGEKTLPLDTDVDIKDVVSYCLKPGYEYALKGVLMDKSTGNGLLVNSELVESEVTFTLEETDDACGEVEMHFKLNTSNLGGKELVVFESLYRDEDLIIEHKDINDEGETVVVDLPAPDTGMMTRSSEHGTSGNMFIVIVLIGTAIGVGGYIVSRKLSRNKFMKKW